ncbi:MAG: FAD-dependent oxidoreductase [Endozoicomonas sp.]
MNDQNNNKNLNRRSFLKTLAVGTTAASTASLASASAKTTWNIKTDVVIVGSGAAGISAAIESARAGLEVLVLEMFQRAGGSSSMSGGVCYLGGGTPLQKAMGFTDTVEDMYNYIVNAGALHPQLDKIQLYCEQSIEHFHWMVDNGIHYNEKFTDAKGLPYDDSSLYYSGSELTYKSQQFSRPAPRGHVPGAMGMTGGRTTMEVLTASAEKLGVKIALNVSGQELVQNSDGSIAGLVVDWQGESKRIQARKGVVLAAGGFIHNREMTRLHAPELHNCTVPWGNAGDQGMGIQMGMSVGGVGLRMNQGFAIIPLYQPESVLKGIVVNQHGQRFISEDNYHAMMGHEITYNQHGKGWLITDENSSYQHDDHRIKVQAESDSIAELEQLIELPEGTLQQTVDYYNRHAEKQQDPLFHKSKDLLTPLNKPPFKAWNISVDTAFFPAHTFGGLHTNVDSQAINAGGEPIPGLYAAGRTSAGLPTAPYIASGISIGDCTFFGRRAGKHIARTTS